MCKKEQYGTCDFRDANRNSAETCTETELMPNMSTPRRHAHEKHVVTLGRENKYIINGPISEACEVLQYRRLFKGNSQNLHDTSQEMLSR